MSDQAPAAPPAEAEPQIVQVPADSLRTAAKQASSGYWTFEVSIDTSFLDEITNRANMIGVGRRELNGGRQLAGEEIKGVYDEAIAQTLGNRAKLVALAAQQLEKEFRSHGHRLKIDQLTEVSGG